MCYIQASAFDHHGQLRPSNCLVDQRLTIRITDFGRKPVLDHTKVDLNDSHHNRKTHFLYAAPEVLILGENSTNLRLGDTYAFAIMLHQILFRCEPFWINSDEDIRGKTAVVFLKQWFTMNFSRQSQRSTGR